LFVCLLDCRRLVGFRSAHTHSRIHGIHVRTHRHARTRAPSNQSTEILVDPTCSLQVTLPPRVCVRACVRACVCAFGSCECMCVWLLAHTAGALCVCCRMMRGLHRSLFLQGLRALLLSLLDPCEYHLAPGGQSHLVSYGRPAGPSLRRPIETRGAPRALARALRWGQSGYHWDPLARNGCFVLGPF
jgi:hypothetical protein